MTKLFGFDIRLPFLSRVDNTRATSRAERTEATQARIIPKDPPRTHQESMSQTELDNFGMKPRSGSTLRGQGFFSVSSQEVQRAKESSDPKAQAEVLQDIIRDRTNILFRNDAKRLERMKDLLGGMSAEQIDGVRAAYIERFGKDPEVDIRSWDLLQPLSDLSDELELEMTATLTGPRHRETAKSLSGFLEKAKDGTLTQEDRKTYFSMMAKTGLWNPPLRPDAQDKDAMERTILKRMWSEQPDSQEMSIDKAMKTIEAGLPPADLTPKAPREKSVAVIVSSAGAQWQELMGWAKEMDKAGYHLQLFTPNGRPVAFQHDSMSVSSKTRHLGFGSPPDLDPAGETGKLASKLLGNTTGAENFNPEHFGAVYSAGGLGFNEDVAKATPKPKGKGADLAVNPNIASMMKKAVDARLPNIAICHGPTLYAATPITINGREEPLSRGLKTASLPPFEGYVGFTERKEPQFTYDLNTHRALEASGGETSVFRDVLKMNRVVTDHKDGMDIITGPGPQAANELAHATIEALKRRWQ